MKTKDKEIEEITFRQLKALSQGAAFDFEALGIRRIA